MSFLKDIHDSQNFLSMNFIVYLSKKKLMKTKTDRMKKVVFFNLWEYGTQCKVKRVHIQINGLERSPWIKSGAIMKETFKDWKAHFASGLQMKIWSFQVKQMKGVTVIS
jgi:hypothetical protein